jgi:hypothetical protein
MEEGNLFGISSSRVSLALSATALFVALGGTALAVTQIGTDQIKNGAVTTSKLHKKAVTNAKLGKGSVGNGKIANSAVTGSKVKDGSLTASDVAPNTFLAANGTAANASRLGGLLPADFVQGVGVMSDRRIVVAGGTSGAVFLNSLFGAWTANCDATNKPSVTWSPTVSNAEYAATVLQAPSTAKLDTLNGIPAGGSAVEPATPGNPFSVTYQIGFTSGGQDHVVTAWITGRTEGASCVFVGQELTTG